VKDGITTFIIIVIIQDTQLGVFDQDGSRTS